MIPAACSSWHETCNQISPCHTFFIFFIFTITSPPPLFIMSAVCSPLSTLPHWTLLNCLWSPKWCIAPYCFCFYFLKRSHLSSVLFYIKLLIEIYDKRINLVFYIIRTGLKNIRATLLWTNFYMETGDWSLESGVWSPHLLLLYWWQQ